jgi:hypothetical protein
LARPRQKTVRLKEFFERPEHADVWTEFDADEWITVIAYGSLPAPLVDEDRALRDELLGVERIADEGERRATVERIAKAQADLKVRQRRLMLVDWNVKRPSDGKPFKKPSEGYDPVRRSGHGREPRKLGRPRDDVRVRPRRRGQAPGGRIRFRDALRGVGRHPDLDAFELAACGVDLYQQGTSSAASACRRSNTGTSSRRRT